MRIYDQGPPGTLDRSRKRCDRGQAASPAAQPRSAGPSGSRSIDRDLATARSPPGHLAAGGADHESAVPPSASSRSPTPPIALPTEAPRRHVGPCSKRPPPLPGRRPRQVPADRSRRQELRRRIEGAARLRQAQEARGPRPTPGRACRPSGESSLPGNRRGRCGDRTGPSRRARLPLHVPPSPRSRAAPASRSAVNSRSAGHRPTRAAVSPTSSPPRDRQARGPVPPGPSPAPRERRTERG
jgi:hypothetical protein